MNIPPELQEKLVRLTVLCMGPILLYLSLRGFWFVRQRVKKSQQ